jgi:hypothetical protein
MSMATLGLSFLSGQFAAQAEFIVNNLVQTDYQHDENINVAEGVYDLDCNGFVGFVVESLAPKHYGLIPKESDQPRPRAFEYYVFFTSLTLPATGGWRRIDSLQDARRGDILAWRFREILPGQDTGHVLFLAQTPRPLNSGVLAVRVYDSADSPHFDDTRGNEPGQFPNGVGSGLINFEADDQGAPTAFQFGPSEPFKSFPIAIGRAEPFTVAPSNF